MHYCICAHVCIYICIVARGRQPGAAVHDPPVHLLLRRGARGPRRPAPTADRSSNFLDISPSPSSSASASLSLSLSRVDLAS